MTLLRLNQVTVHVADADAITTQPAPDGLHVWLDVPGGRFDFNHYVVRGGHLSPAPHAHASGQLDTRWAYWCVHATDGALPVAARDQPFQRIQPAARPAFPTVRGHDPGPTGTAPSASFGYPLPARIWTGNRLVLPNRRTVTLHGFDLTGDPTTPLDIMPDDLYEAKRFYQDALIDFQLVRHTPPSPGPWTLRHTSTSLEILGPNGAVLNPDLSQSAWNPSGSATSAVMIIWIRAFHEMGTALAITWPLLQAGIAGRFSQGEAFQLPNYPLVLRPLQIFNSDISSGRLTETIANARNKVSHEIGHALSGAPGGGQRWLTTSALDTDVKTYLAGLNLEGPLPRGTHAGDLMFADLPPAGIHDLPPGNLMAVPSGFNLTPWQIAVMRAAEQVGDGPTAGYT